MARNSRAIRRLAGDEFDNAIASEQKTALD